MVVTGEGSTKEEATNNALRSAIEQAFGVFVSANTEILNDEIVKDDIATISSGNVKSYREIAAIESSSGTRYVTLEAVVSIGKLIEYSKSHGSKAEFAGAVFGANLRLREQRKKEESEVLEHYLNQMFLVENYYDAEIEIGNPYLSSVQTIPFGANIVERRLGKNHYYNLWNYECPMLIAKDVGIVDDEMYLLPLAITFKATRGCISLFDGLIEVIKQLSLKEDEIKEYDAEKVPYFRLRLMLGYGSHLYCFRSYKSIVVLADLSRLLSCRLIKDWEVELKYTDNKADYYRLKAPSWVPLWVDFISRNDIYRNHGFFPLSAFEENGLSSIKEYSLRKKLGYLPYSTIDFFPDNQDDSFVMNLVIENLFKATDHKRIFSYLQNLPEDNKRIPWDKYSGRQVRIVDISGDGIPGDNWYDLKKHRLSLALEPRNASDPIIIVSGMKNPYPVVFFDSETENKEETLNCDYELYGYKICIPLSQEKLSKVINVSVNNVNDLN